MAKTGDGYEAGKYDAQSGVETGCVGSLILLEYDESLEPISLSTGTEKSDDKKYETVYLRVSNNRVSDTVWVTTSDNVEVEVRLAMTVNFEDLEKAFDVEDYVKLMTDNVRSRLKGEVRKMTVQDFYAQPVDAVRDVILGVKPPPSEDGVESLRSGLKFLENGMRVVEVDVLKVSIEDASISVMFEEARRDAVARSVKLVDARQRLEVSKEIEEIARRQASEMAETKKHAAKVETDIVRAESTLVLARSGADKNEVEAAALASQARETIKSAIAEASRIREKADADQDAEIRLVVDSLDKARLEAEVDAMVKRFGAAGDGFTEALTALSSQETLTKIAEAMSVQSFVGGKDLVSVIRGVFEGTPLGDKVGALMTKSAWLPSGNGAERHDQELADATQ